MPGTVAKRKSSRKPKTAKDRLKLSVAKQLGLWEQVQRDGWGSLSAKECGQIGGVLSRLLKEGKGSALQEKVVGNSGRA
ncbi:MAG: small, acid-soluble spore protein, alpha/beta type [Bacteroidota bacterium]